MFDSETARAAKDSANGLCCRAQRRSAQANPLDQNQFIPIDRTQRPPEARRELLGEAVLNDLERAAAVLGLAAAACDLRSRRVRAFVASRLTIFIGKAHFAPSCGG
jgi:hypothetical protein